VKVEEQYIFHCRSYKGESPSSTWILFPLLVANVYILRASDLLLVATYGDTYSDRQNGDLGKIIARFDYAEADVKLILQTFLC
jgi:hypothetical protein